MTTQNLFAYCGNNPVNNTDTSGHIFAGAVIGGIIGGIFGGLGALVQGESVLVGAATGALAGMGIGLICSLAPMHIGIVLVGAITGAENIGNQVVNNYIDNTQTTSQNSAVDSEQNSLSVQENLWQIIKEVDYGEVAGAVAIGMAFAPLSYATGKIAKDAFLGMETYAIDRMTKRIVEGVFEFNISATQFVVDLF